MIASLFVLIVGIFGIILNVYLIKRAETWNQSHMFKIDPWASYMGIAYGCLGILFGLFGIIWFW